MFDTNENNEQKKSFLGKVVIAAAMLTFAYIVIIMTPVEYRATLQSEINALKEVIGQAESKEILSRANNMYTTAFVETGAILALEELVIATGINGEDLWRTPLIRVAENIKLMFYQSAYRLSVFIHWLALVAPFIFALAADGYYKRKKKQYEFGVASANLFRIWTKASFFSFFILDIYFIFPAAGIWGPLLPPIMFAILGFSLRYTLSNMSKVF